MAARKKAPEKAKTDKAKTDKVVAGGTPVMEEVVVRGRPLVDPTGKKAPVYQPTDESKEAKSARVITVRAIRDGEYGHRVHSAVQGEAGQTFQMRVGKGDLPSWVEEVDKKDANSPPDRPTEPRRKDDKDVINDLLNNAGLDAAGEEKAPGDDHAI